MRIFIAIEILPDVRKRIDEQINVLRGQFPELRVGWERSEKLHLTLKFLGEVEESRLQEITAAAENAAQTVSPFELKIENSGFFPPRGQPRILWFGIKDDSGELSKLQQRLQNECERIGFEREKRNFSPHLTVARLREPNKSIELAKMHQNTRFETGYFPINQITVFQSRLTPAGSFYHVLAQISLNVAQN